MYFIPTAVYACWPSRFFNSRWPGCGWQLESGWNSRANDIAFPIHLAESGNRRGDCSRIAQKLVQWTRNCHLAAQLCQKRCESFFRGMVFTTLFSIVTQMHRKLAEGNCWIISKSESNHTDWLVIESETPRVRPRAIIYLLSLNYLEIWDNC